MALVRSPLAAEARSVTPDRNISIRSGASSDVILLRGAISMKFPAAFVCLSLLAASPALAWSGSTLAGDYRVTAEVDANKLQSVSFAPQAGTAVKPMQLYAWFVDEEGAILAQAPLANANPNGATLIALGKSTPVPTAATALIVMAQPAGLTRTAASAQPALVAQIALR